MACNMRYALRFTQDLVTAADNLTYDEAIEKMKRCGFKTVIWCYDEQRYVCQSSVSVRFPDLPVYPAV